MRRRCMGLNWKPCNRPAQKKRALCKEHNTELEEALDQLTAMSHLGCDEYGSID